MLKLSENSMFKEKEEKFVSNRRDKCIPYKINYGYLISGKVDIETILIFNTDNMGHFIKLKG